jgi:hypothetical protein
VPAAAVVAEARPVLAQLALLPHGTTTSLDPTKGSRNSETPLRPAGELHPPHEVYAQRILAAPSDAAARAAIAEAADVLAHYRRRTFAPVREETLDELKARILTDGGGWAPDEVARNMRCLPRVVRVARIEANLHPETGYPIPEAQDDTWAWAADLRDRGLTLRQIAAITGLALASLSRRLR